MTLESVNWRTESLLRVGKSLFIGTFYEMLELIVKSAEKITQLCF